jgi:hypothetical protein
LENLSPGAPLLSPLFDAVSSALEANRQDLNRADLENGDHGEHMVEVFQIAAQAAEARQDASLADGMEYAAQRLEAQINNGSAQVYAHGLRQMGEQLRRRDVTLEDLIATVRGAVLTKDSAPGSPEAAAGQNDPSRSAETLKALLAGLAAWNQVEDGKPVPDNPLDMGAMFEFGMAYLQAKQRNQERIDVLADAAASASPLGKIPYRYRSGVIAIRALLQAMQRP